MEHKEWSYEDFPEFMEHVEGVEVLDTTGEETGVIYIHDVEYLTWGDCTLHLQILRPVSRSLGEKQLPCVLFVQGSAWMKQDVYAQIPMISRLAERGYVVAVVEYRHSEIAIFPAQVLDARNAVRYIRMHGEKYGIDTDNLFLAGDSSGGHTAMFAGLIHDDDSADNRFPGVSAEVNGIINYYGSCSVMREDSNPTTMNHHMPDSPEGMEMGKVNLKEHPELCEKLSVECNITEESQIVPTLIFHGTKDRTVNTYNSVDLYRQMKKCGKDVSMYLVKGADHGGPEFWTPAVLDLVDTFIKKLLKETGGNK